VIDSIDCGVIYSIDCGVIYSIDCCVIYSIDCGVIYSIDCGVFFLTNVACSLSDYGFFYHVDFSWIRKSLSPSMGMSVY